MIWNLYYDYGYLFLVIAFGIFWLFIFLYRKDLRKEMILTSFIFSLMGFTEVIFKEYWSPKSIFGLIENIGFGIEDIFFCFFLGGISATLWEFVFNKREITIKHKINNHHVLAIGGVIVNLVLLFEIFLPNYTIFYSCFLMIILVYFGAYKYRKDLLKYITESGIVFMVYYLIILKAIFHPVNYFERFYHDNFLTKINLFGMPIEEFLFGFAFGTLGAFLYKFLYDKKVVNIKS